MAKREYTVVSFLIKPESVHKSFKERTAEDVIPMDELTPEQRERWVKEAAERSGRIMSEYFSRHPDLFELLPD